MRSASFARRLPGSTLIGLAALAAVLVTSGRANATRRHVHLVKSEPGANDTLTASPKTLKFWFSEKVELPVTTVKLTNAGGTAVALEAAKRDAGTADAPVWVGVTKTLAPGWYTVNWSTAAKDGHPEKGTFAFAVKPSR